MQAIPATVGTIILSVDYDATALVWARMFDNQALGWVVDETGAIPAIPAVPVIIGSFPPVAADTTPIMSPQWANLEDTIESDPVILIPDKFRGTASEFFTWLATNNGATRQVDANFEVSLSMKNMFETWKRANPTLVFTG